MSRYTLTKDQLDLLTMDQLDDLRLAVCQEMDSLGRTEHLIYARRRELECAQYPHLMDDYHAACLKAESTREQRPTHQSDLAERLIAAASAQGVSLTDLLNSSLTEQ
jgi:hypothetical protein